MKGPHTLAQRDYPAIIRKIKALKLAPHGTKRGHQRALTRLRLLSLKREVSTEALKAAGRAR